MEFDFSQVIVPVGGTIVYPDFPYGNQPVLPSAIKDSASIRGRATDGGSIVGSASSQGNVH